MFLARLLVAWMLAAGALAQAVDGTLSLDGAALAAAPLPLHGDWLFFADRWVTPATLPTLATGATPLAVPAGWTAANRGGGHGIGTYWLQLRLDQAPAVPLALRLEQLCGASAIYLFRDGVTDAGPLLLRGRLARQATGETVAGGAALITLPALSPGLYHLLVQHSNHQYHAGGICGRVSLGTASRQLHNHHRDFMLKVAAVTLLLALAGGTLLLRAQNAERTQPWLALLCVGIAILVATSNGLINALIPPETVRSHPWQYSLAYVAQAWISLALLMLYRGTFEVSPPRPLVHACLAATGLATVALALLPPAVFMPHTGWLAALCALQISAALGVVLVAVRRRRPRALLVLVSVLPMLVTLPIDFYRYTFHGDTALLSPYPLAFMIVVHGGLYTLKLGRAYRLAARLSAHLQEEVERRTRELSDKNEKLTRAQAALQQANAALRELSITDGLTQVYNRMYFEQQLEQEWRRCARQGLPLSVLMIDADHFKQLNDSAGHLAGDRCLQAIAAELERHFKRAGELAARYGGEEFIVLLPDTGQTKALALAEGFRRTVERLDLSHAGQPCAITVSIGVSTTIPSMEQPPAQLLATADAALYEAKGAGRNRVHSVPLLGQRRGPRPQQSCG